MINKIGIAMVLLVLVITFGCVSEDKSSTGGHTSIRNQTYGLGVNQTAEDSVTYVSSPVTHVIIEGANPATVYCIENGGGSEITTVSDGSQFGSCILEDASRCEEWAYYRGECG